MIVIQKERSAIHTQVFFLVSWRSQSILFFFHLLFVRSWIQWHLFNNNELHKWKNKKWELYLYADNKTCSLNNRICDSRGKRIQYIYSCIFSRSLNSKFKYPLNWVTQSSVNEHFRRQLNQLLVFVFCIYEWWLYLVIHT